MRRALIVAFGLLLAVYAAIAFLTSASSAFAAPTAASPACVPDCDLNNDGRVDALDIARARLWFKQGPQGDVNADLITDARDIAIVRAHYLEVPVGSVYWDPEEEILFAAINDYRAHPERWELILVCDPTCHNEEPDRTVVLQPVQRGYRLSQAAQWMSQHTADNNFLSHTDLLGRDAGARMVAYWYEARYTWMGEIALGTDGGGSVAGGQHSFIRWTLSPGHNGIMISPYVSVGIGHAVAADGQHRWYADFSSGVDGWP